jgi:adenine/guanine phosphoribosyltransferase-like PRPP-binding protein
VARARFLAAALLITTVTGCAHDVANRYYTSQSYEPKEVAAVEVLWRKPAKPFVVIADFQSRGETADALREKAAKLGADAVIVAVVGGLYALGEQWAGKDSMATTTSSGTGHIVGTAIRYK